MHIIKDTSREKQSSYDYLAAKVQTQATLVNQVAHKCRKDRNLWHKAHKSPHSLLAVSQHTLWNNWLYTLITL